MGKLLSRKLVSANYTTSLPGAPHGKYVIVPFDTSFENKASAVETVTPMQDADGVWRVAGYRVAAVIGVTSAATRPASIPP